MRTCRSTSTGWGFRLKTIFPADNPAVAVVTGHGLRIRLERGAEEPPGTIRLLCEHPDRFAAGETELTAPNGTRIEIRPAGPAFERPPTRHALVVQRLNESEAWVVGRAGMQYRDLVPGRLGGAVIASHIRIREGGPVPDMVHFHTITFQLIYCCRGWFDLVYEDQGPPFRLEAGDCVIQPSQIRHRVLESSDNGEVIELGVPAEHLTTIDHELALPTRTSTRSATSTVSASATIGSAMPSGRHGGCPASRHAAPASTTPPAVWRMSRWPEP